MQAIHFFDDDIIDLSYKTNRGTLIEAHIADLHFTAINPKSQYEILEQQFLNKIIELPKLDIISVNGDLFDHKIMSNSDGALYATMFIDRLVQIARMKNSTIVLIHGTYLHDADQLKLFYHYLEDPSIDIRIVTNIKFEYIKGAKILCIPELYGLDENIYKQHLLESGIYDSCFMHGTIKGAIYGDTVGNGRLFTIEDFCNCTGPIISGHVHKPGCFNTYFYYCGTPIRYKFGEEEAKGFLIVAHDLDSGYHYTHFEEIKSYKYITVNFDDIIKNKTAKDLIDYINNYRILNEIDFLKVRFTLHIDQTDKVIIGNYYRNNPTIFVEFLDIEKETMKKMEEEIAIQNDYDFIFDNRYSDEEKFCMYVNKKEGYDLINVEKLRQILEE